MNGFGSLVQTASIAGAGGVLAIAGWHMLRMLFFVVFVLIMCHMQGRKTGRYPTLVEATMALRRLLTR